MRQIAQAEPQYALGEPTNRKPDTGLTPIAGRPNWYQPRSGEPVYVEPTKPPKAPVVPAWSWKARSTAAVQARSTSASSSAAVSIMAC